MLQRYKKNRTSASFLLTKCATFLIKCYWGTFSVPSDIYLPLFIYKVYKKKTYPKNLRMCIFSCNVEDTDLVSMLVKHAHEPTSKLLHPNAVHTQIC